MARGRCPDCGATVDFVQVGDQKVPLDIAEDPSADADLYVIVGHSPLCAVKAAPGSRRGMPDHRADCPGHHAGR